MNTKIDDILSKLHIEDLNSMQNASINAILHTNKDVVILSPTGSGKTLGYLLPVSTIIQTNKNEIQAIVIVPGRELALQTNNVCQSFHCGIRSMALYGGRATMDEHRILKDYCPHIIFVTPGRLNDHIDKGNIDVNNVHLLIIDEFDKCLRLGFHQEMYEAIKKLPNIERRILLSATDAEEIPSFVNMGRTERVDYIVNDDQISERVKQYIVKSPDKDKLNTLFQLICTFGNTQTIVFLNFRDSVNRTCEYLRQKGIVVCEFHGGMEQKEREAALYKFSNGSANVFVCTDLASRGLDIPNVNNVIHYHLPIGEEEYVHRVGRTARWNAEGKAFFLLGPSETLPEYINNQIPEYTLSNKKQSIPNPQMATLYIGKGKKDKISKGDVVGFLCKLGDLKSSEIGKIDVKDRYTYVAVKYELWESVVKKTSGQKLKGIKTLTEIIS